MSRDRARMMRRWGLLVIIVLGGYWLLPISGRVVIDAGDPRMETWPQWALGAPTPRSTAPVTLQITALAKIVDQHPPVIWPGQQIGQQPPGRPGESCVFHCLLIEDHKPMTPWGTNDGLAHSNPVPTMICATSVAG